MGITFKRFLDMDRSASLNARWERTYNRSYRGISDAPTMGPKAVLQAFVEEVYAIGSPYEWGTPPGMGGAPPASDDYEKDDGSYLQQIDAGPEKSGDALNWIVACSYGPAEPLDEDPLDRFVKVTWNQVATEEIVDVDRDGVAVVNTASDPFDPPVVRDRFNALVRVARNEAEFPFHLVGQIVGGYNIADFLEEGDAEKWLIRSITSQSERIKVALLAGVEITYWPVEYEVERNEDGWKHKIVNAGMRQLNTAGTGYEPILVKGQPISSPAFLDEDGRALAPDGEPFYLEFKTAKPVDFNLLNFAGVDFGQGPI